MHVMGSVSPANEREGFQEEGVAIAVPMSPPAPSIFPIVEGNRSRPPAPAPPPPPPPPPPPLPPPPPPPPLLPLGPGLGDPVGGQRRKRRVRSFAWKTIPEDQVKGRANLWTQGRVQQQYQIDVQTVEDLFGQHDCQSNTGATPTRGGKARLSFRETKEEVSILDSKRGMNVGIFLKQFKRSNQTIIDDIHHGNSEFYGAEPLRELLKLLPETEEVKKLKSYRGDVSKLSLADSFMYLLTQLPSYSVRIESMLLKEEFPGACEAMKRDISTLRSATRELLYCEELHAVLHLVLQAGNILNAGGYAGNAVGFKLSSLLSLADTKANRPGMNLLHFVALEAQKKDEKLLEFPVKLKHVQTAARISVETLDADLHWLTSRTRSVEESVQRDTELLQQLDRFLQDATSSLCSVRRSRQELRREGSDLIDFFCEDRQTFRLDDCFSVFHHFCIRFNTAVKENMEREMKEVARRRRLRELEEQKRHSWAGGEEVGGAFGLRCRSETCVDAALSRHDDVGLLMELLTPKPRPRSPLNNSSSHSPLGRSGSLRRSRNSPSSLPSVAAERELNTLLGMATLGLAAHSFPQNQQPRVGEVAQQTSSSPSKTSRSPENSNTPHTTTTYLNRNATQPGPDATGPTNKVTVTPTSDSNLRRLNAAWSDHNNNNKDQLGRDFSSQETGAELQNDFDLRENAAKITEATEKPGNMNNLSVILEKHTLVAELQAFDKVAAPSDHTPRPHDNRRPLQHHDCHLGDIHGDDIVITDLEEEGIGRSQIAEAQNNSRLGNTERSEEGTSESHSSSAIPPSLREEEEGKDEKVAVWCVTGVCEREDVHTDDDDITYTLPNIQEGNNNASCIPANHMPSEAHPSNQKPVPVCVNSQPVPVSHSDPSFHASYTNRPSAEPASANEMPALTPDASKEAEPQTNQGTEPEDSTNEKRGLETFPEQSRDEKSEDETTPLQTTIEKTELDSSSNKNQESATSSKPSTKTLPSKVRPVSIKISTTTSRRQPVRTLTSSENQGMRRVVPISKPSRSAPSLGKRLEKPPGHHQGTSSTPPTSLTISNPNNASLRRGERPSTAPSSRRSSIHKQDPKESKDQKVLGVQGSARDQIQALQRRPSLWKPMPKPKAPPEEKMCRSTLRALAQAGVGGGGGGEGGGGGRTGSVSAPPTPSHKVAIPTSSTLPGFARNTASSSFRRTHTTLALPPSHSAHDGSPKTSSSPSASPFIRTGSLRVPASSRSSVLRSRSSSLLPPDQDSPLKRSQSIRLPPRSPLHDSLAPPKGHRRNNSGNFSDKSSHSKDSGKASKPSWR